MEIQILGAHCVETKNTRLTSILIDGVLALDAGGLTSGLSLEEQRKVRAILLSHCHLDHIRDTALIAYNTGVLIAAGLPEAPKSIYATPETLESFSAHIINNQIFPDFTCWPTPEKPSLELHPLEPYQTYSILGYSVMALPVKHAVPTVGYQIAQEGKSLFFTGDTGPGLGEIWKYVAPDLLIVELSGANKHNEDAARLGHLTPELLKAELVEFQQQKGYLPEIIFVHLVPQEEAEMKQEIAEVAQELKADMSFGYEGMRLIL
jgi:ribonuclease BN (tRNA processing enzyme)